MKRTDIINYLVTKCNYSTYLEIGVKEGDNFNAINIKHKIGVDPDTTSAAARHITSDAFFADNKDKFDIIFIDGLHHAEQVEKDVINARAFLNKGGTIVMHDCSPASFAMQIVPRMQQEWTGDCWKAFVRLRKLEGLEMRVVNCDYGVGIVREGNMQPLIVSGELNYQALDKNRKNWLNLISEQEFHQLY